ncbi:MAG: hypothetical protein J5I90_06920 [Caldilineales bacterium]|nr:hypothetical protein [Caldilineales bacterium]
MTKSANRPLRHIGVVGLFFALMVLLTWPMARSMGSAIPGDSFDGWQNYWNLWWVRSALLDLHTHPYFTSALYHPTGVSLWFQTINIFNGLIALPVQLAGNLYWAYNFVVMFSFVAAGYGATLLAVHVLHQAGARDTRAVWLSAVLAGFVFTFSPFHLAHLLGHMQVFSLEFVPFYIFYLLQAVPPQRAGFRWRKAGMAAFFLILAGLCDWYFVLYLGLFTLLYVIWLAVRRQFALDHLKALALIAVVFLVVTAPLLAPMVSESIRYDFMRPPPGQVTDLSADVLGFVLPSGQHSLWGEWAAQARANLPASPSENTLYAGFAVLALALIGLIKRRLRLGFFALAAVVFAIFALGPVLHIGGQIVTLPGGRALPMPYALLLKLPFIEIARTVARYDLIVMLCLGILAAGGIYSLIVFSKRNWLAVLLALAVVIEFLPIPYPISPPDTPAWYQTLATEPGDQAILNLPMNWDRPGYLLYQTVHGKPLTAGYISRDDPRTLPPRIPIVSDLRHNGPDINSVDPALYAPTIFEFLDIGWVVADRYKMPEGDERILADGMTSAIFAGHPPLYEDDRLSVYKTWPPETRLAFIELGFDWGPYQPDPARAVLESASFTIHSPDANPRRLTIQPASDNAVAFQLEDSEGRVLGASDGAALQIDLALNSGENRFTLRAAGPGLSITALKLDD